MNIHADAENRHMTRDSGKGLFYEVMHVQEFGE